MNTSIDDLEREVPAVGHPAAPPGSVRSRGGDSAGGHSGDAAASDEVHFGEVAPTRCAADVEYRGMVGKREFVVRARHRLLRTTFTLEIDGIPHDPAAETKARTQQEGRAEEGGGSAEDGGAPVETSEEQGVASSTDEADEETGAGLPLGEDGLRFVVSGGSKEITCDVQRPRSGREHVSAERVTIRTAGLGGAGEVDVRHGFTTVPLVPAEGSPSAARDARRTQHPVRFALLSALAASAKVLVPLLGLGALLSGLLDPVAERLRPAVEAIGRFTAPVREWLGSLLSPVWDLLGAILRPLRDLLRWLVDLIPDLGIDIPDWIPDLAVPAGIVALAFFGTLSTLKDRRGKLDEARPRPEEDSASLDASPDASPDAAPDASPDVEG